MPTNVLAYVLLPAAALVVAGGGAIVRAPGPGVRSGLQHFAAGVVFAAVAGELVPDLERRHAALPTVLGFAVGVAVMLAVEYGVRRVGGSDGDRAAAGGMLAVVGIDLLIDGLLLGVGFAAGEALGRLIAVALGLELASLGVTVSAGLVAAGVRPARVVALLAGVALAFVLGAGAGLTALGGLTGSALVAVLAFGAAALLYLVTEELLVEAHEHPGEPPLRTALFFVGFLALLLVEMASAGT